MCRPDGAAASDREKEGFASTQAKWMPSKYVPESIDTNVYMLVDLYCRYICLHSRFTYIQETLGDYEGDQLLQGCLAGSGP